MSFFATDSLVTKSLRAFDPWTFSAPMPSEKVRLDKVERQFWYKSVSTVWNFYSALEGSNPNQRISKANPPRLIHGIAVDYDMAIPDSRVIEAIAGLKIKPAWYERSLGGNVRLVWPFPRPLNLDSYDFAVFMLDKSRVWLNLEILPGLDAPALTDPTRLLCNGNQWFATGAPAMEERELQSFYVECGKEFRFNSSDEHSVPLDVVEQEIIKRFANFSWPTDFALESTGPSFWVAGSESPNSAIVKPDGMFSFSAHATKPFYSWGDILGADFVKQFVQTSVTASTDDVWWDGKNFWKKEQSRYVDVAKDELTLFLRVDCRLSSKPGKSGISPLDVALRHIQSANRIAGAAPFVFRPHGILNYQNERKLNICMVTVMPPAEGDAEWGASGQFPWLSEHFDNFFDPPEQLPFFLAWLKAFYESGYYQKPMPGQNVFFMGSANSGKTMTSHAIIGKCVGGFMDAAKNLTTNGDFNSELPGVPLWTIDDETMGESPKAQANFGATWKKSAANQNIRCHKKYGIPVMTEWAGRILATSNLDAVSSRILSPMDNSSLDKTSLFRVGARKTEFPNRHELVQIIDRELPYLLRWLLNWTPPEQVKRDVRYGFAAYHEELLLDKAHQSGKAAPFKELLVESLENYFSLDREAKEWRGTITQILRLIQSNPLNESIIRTLRLEQTQRYLESLQRDGILKCDTELGPLKTRVWTFSRFEHLTEKETTVETKGHSTNAVNIFQK